VQPLLRGRTSPAHSDQVRRRLEDGPARLFGHEFCGTIVETGEDVADFEVGDRIYAPGKTPCEECAYCTSGYENYCPNKTQIGYDTPGALSEYFVLPEGPLCKLPDEVSDAGGRGDAALRKHGPVRRDRGIHAWQRNRRRRHRRRDGLSVRPAAKLFGGDRVYAIDIDQENWTSPRSADSSRLTRWRRTPPRSFARTRVESAPTTPSEAAGRQEQQEHGTEGNDPLAQAMNIVRRGGTVVQIGHIIGDIEMTPRGEIQEGRLGPADLGVTSFSPNMDSARYAAKLVATGQTSIDDYITHELRGSTPSTNSSTSR